MSGIIGLISVSAATPGASEVQAKRAVTVSDSSTRATLFTPASGRKVRIISAHWINGGSTTTNAHLYFGTGADPGADAAKIIFEASVDLDTSPSEGESWPDGGGPIGAADEVVSIATGTNIGGDGIVTIVFREE